MSQPETVQSDLGDEAVVARVDLGGEDELYVTPTRTLVYRAEGLLSNESVDEYPHGAERITVSEGRRKAKVTLDYGLDGERTISLPSSRLERALTPIVEGVLRDNGVLDEDESVAQLFRFNELTLIVAGKRVVRHIGPWVWDEEAESYHYSDITDLEFEDGSVNTSVVLTVDGQRERFKTPNEDARAVRSTLESTLLSYRNVDSVEALRDAAAPDESDADATESEGAEEVSFSDGPDPLFADPTEPEEFPDNATRAADDGASKNDPTREGKAAEGRTALEGTSDPGDDVAGSEAADAADAGAGAEASGTGTGSTPASDARSETNQTAAATDSGTRGSGGSGGGTEETPDAGTAPEPPDAGFEGSGFEAAAPAADERILEELATVREAVERQNQELTAQRELIEQLIEELRRGR